MKDIMSNILSSLSNSQSNVQNLNYTSNNIVYPELENTLYGQPTAYMQPTIQTTNEQIIKNIELINQPEMNNYYQTTIQIPI